MRNSFLITAITLAGFGLSSCAATKIVTAPVKLAVGTTKVIGNAAIGTTKFVGNTAIGTTKFVGNTAIGGTKLVGEGLWATGKGVYYVGTVPVKVTNAALDTTSKLLTITTQAVDLSGKVVTVSRNINAARLDAELAGLKSMKNVLSVFVDAAG